MEFPWSLRLWARVRIAVRTGCMLGLAVTSVLFTGCLSRPSQDEIIRLTQSGATPAAKLATVREAWREAQAYIADRPGADMMLGIGDSMKPLYENRTLLVTELKPVGQWRPGDTVAFTGDHGWPVAHMLYAKTADGWRAVSVARGEFDAALVTTGNYLGTVTKAYALLPIGARSHDDLLAELRSPRQEAAGNRLTVLSP
jgi:hypothetical protein